MERKFYAVYRSGQIPNEVAQLLELGNPASVAGTLKIRVRRPETWRKRGGHEEIRALYPLFGAHNMNLMSFNNKPELEVVFGD